MDLFVLVMILLLNSFIVVARGSFETPVKSRIARKPVPLEKSAESGIRTASVPVHRLSSLSHLRGGSSVGFNLTDILKKSRIPVSNAGTTEVLVATSIGSVFLDKKKKIIMGRNETISDLKEQINKKFPGSPPVLLQNLYFASRLLDDNEFVGNISRMSPVPVVLDMVSGTSVYNKTLTISQALEAYVASVVQQTYLGAKLQQQYRPDAALNESVAEPMDSPQLSELFQSINASVYERYKDEIAAARAQESEPETSTADTAAWRGAHTSAPGGAVTPLAAAFAKEFDLNWRGVRQYGFYSAVLVIFAFFGAATSEATQLLLCLIPVLWISKLRQLRLLFKVALNLALPVIYEWDFLMPLLPVPLQVIAEHSAKQAREDDRSVEDEAEDTEEYDAKDETERHSTVMDAVLPTRSSLRNVFRRARKVWGISMIKLVDFGTSFGTASGSAATEEINEAVSEDSSNEVSENNDGDDEDGDGNIEEGEEEGEEETEEADEGEAEEEEVQGNEVDSDGEQEIDLDEE